VPLAQIGEFVGQRDLAVTASRLKSQAALCSSL